ncbi:hypothetical protein MKEN_01292400 [Mycena kentingensis (nom. inval.)]|nr:hypothetical protein MKEN_01292400 [Mycena kentingensis (nom. inval.)]
MSSSPTRSHYHSNDDRHGGARTPPHRASSHVSMTALGDQLARSMRLDHDHRSDLYTVARNLDAPQGMQFALVTLFARILQMGQQQQEDRERLNTLVAAVETILERLDENVVLSSSEKNTVSAACKRVVWDPSVLDFDNTSLGNLVLAYLKANTTKNKMKATLEAVGAMERVLGTYIGTKCTHGKNTLRSALINTQGLSATNAMNAIAKKMTGTAESWGPKEMSKLIILRSICRKYPNLMLPRKKRSAVGEPIDNDNESQILATNLFAAFTATLNGSRKKYGSDLTNNEWSQEIAALKAIEMQLFNDDLIESLPTTMLNVQQPIGRPTMPLPQRARSPENRHPLSPRSGNTSPNGSSGADWRGYPSMHDGGMSFGRPAYDPPTQRHVASRSGFRMENMLNASDSSPGAPSPLATFGSGSMNSHAFNFPSA